MKHYFGYRVEQMETSMNAKNNIIATWFGVEQEQQGERALQPSIRLVSAIVQRK